MMLRTLCFILVLWLMNDLSVNGQTQASNNATILNTKQELNKEYTTAGKIKLQLKLGHLLVVRELDTTSINEAIIYVDKTITYCIASDDRLHLAEAYLLRSHLAQIQHDYAKGIACANMAIKTSEEIKNYDMAGEGYVFLWSNNTLNGMSYSDRIPILAKAAACFHIAANKCREADCLREMGDLYHILGQFGMALNILKKSLELSQQTSCINESGTYDLLGVCYLMLGDYKSAIENGMIAVKRGEADPAVTNLSLCTYYNRLGLAYLRSNDVPKAKECLEKSLAIAISCKDPNSILELTINNATLLLEDGNPQKALELIKGIIRKYPEIERMNNISLNCFMVYTYQTLKQYEKAKPYAASIEEYINKDSIGYAAIAAGYNNLIPFYIETGNLNKAIFYADKFRNLSTVTGLPIFRSNYYILKFRLDSASGNYISAIRNYERYNSIKDSLFDETKSMQINQLGILYDLEKKDKNIQVLTTRSQLQQSHLKQATLMRNIYFWGSVLLFVIILLLIYAFRTKLKTNRLLRQQQDVIKYKNESLQHLLTEKEWLVKEIHHRVKNNLHMVVGLLSSQTEFLQGEEALSAIKDSQHRIQAMSLIHQKLYQSESLSYTEMPSYIHDLTAYIKDAYGKDIKILLDIARVEFTLSYSIPIGLILNEAITNAMKYAFPKNDKGIIKVNLKKTGVNEYLLSIQDNGIGLPQGFDPHNCSSLGLNLMMGLSSDLNGTFHISGSAGTLIEIGFKADGVKENN